MKNQKTRFYTFLKLFVGVFSGTVVGTNLCAAPINPQPYEVDNQGEAIVVQRIGDEQFSVTQTLDGHWIAKDSQGVYFYIDESGALSDVKVKNESNRTVSDKRFLETIDPNAVKKAYREAHPNRLMKHRTGATRPSWVPAQSTSENANPEHPLMKMPVGEAHARGTNSFPVLLVSGSGTANCDVTEYTNRLNQEGYRNSNHNGSVRDYFVASSNGAFVPTYDVYEVAVNGTLSSYKENEGGLVSEAIRDLLSKYPNFNASKYDADNDGKIDALGVIYAGTEGDANGLGGFQYELQWNPQGMQNAGQGKSFNNYFIIAQMESSNSILPIATFVHEFSHTMGLRDHYSVQNYPDVVTIQFPGSHAWDVMSTGMYAGGGGCPPAYSAFEKEFMGWITIPELKVSDQTTVITPLQETNVAYKVPVKGESDEFWILENRQLKGWDKNLPNHGMLIWHIDYDEEPWWGDIMNDDEMHQRIDVVEAGDIKVETYYDGFEPTHQLDDPFPGSMNVTSFAGFQSWAGVDQGIALYHITEVNENIYFTTKEDVNVDTGTTPSQGGKDNDGNDDSDEPATEPEIIEKTIQVDLKISQDYVSKSVDLSEIFQLLEVDDAATAYKNGLLLVTAIESNGNEVKKFTAEEPGHWFSRSGNVVDWGEEAYVFAEMNLDEKTLNVGNYPGVEIQSPITIRQAVRYGVKKVIYTVNINLIDPSSVEDVEVEPSIVYYDETIKLKGLSEGEKTFSIYSMQGVELYAERFTNVEHQVELRYWNGAKFLLIVVSGDQQPTMVRKILR